MSLVHRRAGLFCLWSVAAACARPQEVGAPPAPVTAAQRAAPAVSGQTDLTTLMRRTALAFRALPDGRFAAAHPSESIDVTAAATRVRPREAGKLGAELVLSTKTGVAGEARLLPDGTLEIARGELTETWTNDEQGVEQAFRLARPPSAAGDLVVRVEAQGEDYVGVTASGLHFKDPKSGLGLRYGHGTFVDGKGVRTAVPARYVDGAIELRVPASVLSASRYPAVLDPTISAERDVDAPVYTAALRGGLNAGVTSGGGTTVATWTTTEFDPVGKGALAPLWATRIGVDGKPIDVPAVLLGSIALGGDGSAGATQFGGHQVAWDGTEFVVVSSNEMGALSAARFRATATTLAPIDATPVSLGMQGLSRGTVVRAGTAMAYVGLTQTRAAIGAARFLSDATGIALIDASPKTVGAISFTEGGISMFSDGKAVTAASIGSRVLIGVSLGDTAGTSLVFNTLIDRSTFTVIGSSSSTGAMKWVAPPRIASSDSEFFVTRVVEIPMSGFVQYELRGRWFDALGAASGGDLTLPTPVTGMPELVGNVWTGTHYVVGFIQYDGARHNLYSERVTKAVGSLEPPGVVAAAPKGPFGMAGDGGGRAHFVQSESFAGETRQVFGYVAKADGSKLGPERLSLGPNQQTGSQVACDGTNCLVAWVDNRLGGGGTVHQIYAARVKPDGTAVDSVGFRVTSIADADDLSPAVAFDGTRYLIVYASASAGPHGIRGQYVSTAGALEGPSFKIGSAAVDQQAPAVAAASGTSMVVWHQLNAAGYDIYAARTTFTGGAPQLLDATPIAPTTTDRSQSYPSVAAGGGVFLVSWIDDRSGSNLPVSVRLGADGKVLDPIPVALGSVNLVSPPRLSYGGGSTALAVWTEASSTNGDVRGARVKADTGTFEVLDATPLGIGVAAAAQLAPSVAWDGKGWGVAWTDERNATRDLYGARVAPDGTLESVYVVSNSASAIEQDVNLAANGGKTLATYARIGDVSRVELRSIGYAGGLGATCASNADCETGVCADSVCCDKPCGGQCEACNVAGKVGHCSPVSGPPAGARPACSAIGAATPCKAQCNGVVVDKCAFAAPGTVCSGNGCASGVETHASICDGAGKCLDVPRACGSYACDTLGCKSVCTGDADCVKGFICQTNLCVAAIATGKECGTDAECLSGFCTDGVCCGVDACSTGSTCDYVGKKGLCTKRNGTACGADAECGSGMCVDGVCCESKCADQCAACNVPGQLGRCIPAVGAPVGARTACDDGGANVCAAAACDGRNTSKCAGLANGPKKTCATAKCEGDKFTGTSTCDGDGACSTPDPKSCAPYNCTDKGCRSDCSEDAHCASGNVCKDSKCVPKAGATCSSDGLSSIGTDGKTTACTPYRCRSDGTCGTNCSLTSDCAPGISCNAATGACVPNSAPADDGGGCAIEPRSSSAPFGGFGLALLGLGALGLARRRASALNRPA